MSTPSAEYLRSAIVQSLYEQGYLVKKGKIYFRETATKDYYRSLNKLAIQKKLQVSGPGVKRFENRLIQYIANGSDVVPNEIFPKVVLVEPNSEHELLFRYATFH